MSCDAQKPHSSDEPEVVELNPVQSIDTRSRVEGSLDLFDVEGASTPDKPFEVWHAGMPIPDGDVVLRYSEFRAKLIDPQWLADVVELKRSVKHYVMVVGPIRHAHRIPNDPTAELVRKRTLSQGAIWMSRDDGTNQWLQACHELSLLPEREPSLLPTGNGPGSWGYARDADPFLRSHGDTKGPLINIGGGLSPLSIRDQMFRAAVAVDRCWDYGFLGTEKKLVVVGGGVAGVTAALRASRYGAKTILIENEEVVFHRQHECTTRWVSPTQYDWPASHASTHSYPWIAECANDIDLKWPARLSAAHHLAEHWNGQFVAAKCSLSGGDEKLKLLSGVYFNRATLSRDGTYKIGAKRRSDGLDYEIDGAAVVILAKGLGRELCSVSDQRGLAHSGFDFWSEDTFLLENLGCSVPPKVVISGAGDGSLQDLVRIVCGVNSAWEAYQRMPFSDREMSRMEVERRVAVVEDHYQRSFSWSTKAWDCRILSTLHAEYRQIVRQLSERFWGELREILPIRQDFSSLHLVHSCDHFGRCYALNHFVAVVLCEHLRRSRGQTDVCYSGKKIDKVVEPVPNGCGGSGPHQCLGSTHSLSLRDSWCSRGVARSRSSSEANKSLEAQVMVIRHGIEVDGHEIRQILPMRMPWGIG